MISSLIALPDSVSVLSMTDLAWRIGRLVHAHVGLSTLGSEAVAAAEGLALVCSSRRVMTAREFEQPAEPSRFGTLPSNAPKPT